MASFTKKTTSNGQVQYRRDGKLFVKEEIPELVLAKLDIVEEGTPVPEDDAIDTSKVPLADHSKDEKLVKIHLEHPLCVNGKGYRGGTEINDDGEEVDIEIEVPEEIADDLKRIDKQNTTYEKNLHRGQDKSRKAAGVRVEAINTRED